MGTSEAQEWNGCSRQPPLPQADLTMEEVPTQYETEFRQLEGLGTLPSPDQVKGVFVEIVTGE